MSEPESELTNLLTKLSADMGDLADSTSRLAHRSEDNTAIMNSVAELMRGNTAALMNLAAQVQANTAVAERLVAVLQERNKRRWW
jgi:phage shock protein A